VKKLATPSKCMVTFPAGCAVLNVLLYLHSPYHLHGVRPGHRDDIYMETLRRIMWNLGKDRRDLSHVPPRYKYLKPAWWKHEIDKSYEHIRLGAFTATELDKIFSGNKRCQLWIKAFCLLPEKILSSYKYICYSCHVLKKQSVAYIW
jgi:hypothetical protein